MSTNPIFLIQRKMDAIDRRWRWLKFREYLGAAGAFFCFIWLLLEISAWRGILTESTTFYFLAGLFVFCAVIGFLAIFIVVMTREPRRAWLADRLERDYPRLFDRLNTLIFLEKYRAPHLLRIKKKIETQAAEVLEEKSFINPLSSSKAWQCLGMFALLLIAAILFNHHYHPFAKLVSPSQGQLKTKTETPFELVPENVTEQKTNQKPWGEVRIVDPGRDVKLTKIDVLPLQIEMTASANIENPVWITSINGGPETPHVLPPPTEPQYAVYQPLVYLDELKVSDWDVISYYAQSHTADPADYASKIYFIEIRPFREDILKQTGGDTGHGKKARDLLNQINGLITRQMDVLQQTHKFQQTTYPADEMRKQDGKKLTDAESALSSATDNLYGQIVAENENAPIGDILDHLAQAEQEMNKATDALSEDVIPEAKQKEQTALAELISSRKSFLKVVSKNPNAFGGGEGSSSENDGQPPVATTQDSLKALSQVTEMHDKEQAALNKLHQLNQEQHKLAQEASGKDDAGGAASAKSETDLKKNLDQLMQSNPDLFRAADTEKANLESDLSQAIDNLNSNDQYQSQHFLDHAAGDMNDLEKTVQKNHQLQQFAEAYKLNKIINQNIQQLGQEKNKPGSLSPQDIKDLASSAERSTGTLKDITESQDGASFGPELSQALSPENQQALHQALDQLSKSEPGPGSQSAAGSAQDNLSNVSKAFQQSQPTLTKQIKSQDSMQPPAQGDALNQAARQLQSLILAQQKKKAPSGEEQGKEIGEIYGNLQNGLANDTSPQAADVLLQAQNLQNKKDGPPIDASELKKLLDKIEAISAEANDNKKDKTPDSEITVIDASKFPANYRDRIRTYYEQLSSHSQ